MAAMAMTNETATADETDTPTLTESRQAVIGRVLNLSIFFVGIGMFAAAGFALQEVGLFAAYQTTYFSVGVVVGVVGMVLWLLTR